MHSRRYGRLGALALLVVSVFVLSSTVFARNGIKVNGYVIDVTGQEPAVPKDLEPRGEGKYKKWIVQFTGPVKEADKKQLVDLGCRIGDYLPEFAFVVTMDNKTKKHLETLPFINGVVRFKPAYRITKKLKDDAGAVVAEKGKTRKLYIRVDGENNLPVLLSEVLRKNGSILDVGKDIARVEIDQSDIAALSQIEEVLWIEEATDLHLLNDTSKWTIQTYVSGNTRIWDKGLHGEGQIVGIGDTGLDHDMPWFRDPSGTAIGPSHRKIVGYDTTYGDDYDANSPGHGTHVAGTVGGDRTPVDGLATANGMAPKSKFYIQDITPGSSNSVYPPADLGLMFIKAYDAGARLHTNSWGGDSSTYNSLCMSADRFMWDHPDFLALFANGNVGPGTGTVGYPAAAKNVVSVGATENGAGAENVASFSSNGPTADGRIKPTITAPGVAIISADSDGIKNSNNSGTISMSGTSMATPTAAGAAALIRQYYTEGYYPGGSANSADALTPSAALIKATLINSGQNMIGNNIDASIPSTGQGWGRINLSNTLCFSGDPKTLEVVDNNIGLTTGQSWSKTYAATADQPLKVTLVWTDYPGASGAAKALVNDLDLAVRAPDGTTTYLGNVFSNGESATGGSADRLNVEEQVFIKTPSIGSYTITVTGYNIPYGPQPFALVITPQGVIALNKTKYNGSSTVVIGVVDKDMNLSNTAVDELFVTITGTSEPEGEQVRLVETGAATAVFTGAIPLRVGAPAASDGFLDVSDGDIITTTYNDVDDGTGHPAAVTATAVIDTTPPLISAVTTRSLADIQASITWNTNEPADSTINYGETTALGTSRRSSLLQTRHSMDLVNLKEGTTYYYEVISTDEAGNLARDKNGGSFFSFTTTSLPPDLTVYSSVGSETTESRTKIYGTATDRSGVAEVAVNGQPASYRASDGYYEIVVPLSPGPNLFTVIATDTAGNAATWTSTVTAVPIDLVMTSLSGTTAAQTGYDITVTNMVCNLGTRDSTGFFVGIYLTPDNSIPATGTVLGSRYISSLAAGQCSSGIAFVSIPLNSAPGNYVIGAIADYNNLQLETDETNNSFAGNQIAVTGPDLVMSAVSGPASGLMGTMITVSNTVTASADGGRAGVFSVGIYLSSDNVITTSDYFLGYRAVSSLAPGASSTADTAVTLPFTLTSGAYYIGAIADYQNAVKETDVTNNALAGNQITVTGTDLTMSAVSGPTTGLTGGTITVGNAVTASEAGAGAGGFSVGIYLSSDNVITTSDTWIGSRSVSSLAPGASSAADTAVTIPSTLTPGTYYIGAIADSLNQIKESDETNNALAGNQIVVKGADLTMSAVSGPGSVKTENTITVSSTVATAGSSSGFPVGIYVSSDNVITTSDTLIGSRSVSSLAAGASDTADTVVTIPSTIAPGTYYIGAIADYTSEARETDETNNALAGNQITVTGPDLTMSAVSGPATGLPGVAITVSNTVTASSAGGGASNFYVGIYLSSDTAITTSDKLIGSRYVNSLAPGISSAAATAVTIPSTVASGAYYIGAIADYQKTVKETDVTNNALAGNQITVTGPDLTMSAVSGPTTGLTGTTITVSNTVTASADGGGAVLFMVGIYLSSDKVITTSDKYIGRRVVSSLAPGASSAAATAVTIPSTVASGTYYIGAIADYANQATESDETNNALTGNQITVTCPDLTMNSVSGPALGVTGGTITVSNTVAASATGGGAGSFYVGVYLSTDNVITASDLRLGTRSVISLAAGASSAADTTFTIPTTVPPGTYYIGAIADYLNQVTESDETNNASTGNQIVVKGLDLTMSAVSGPGSAKTGDTITVSNTVTTTKSASSFSVGIYLSTDDAITTSDIRLGARSVSSLAAGASSAADTAVTIPTTVPPGTYYIGAIADYNNLVTESDETNNALSGDQITVAGP